jgi:hypothetical protein
MRTLPTVTSQSSNTTPILDNLQLDPEEVMHVAPTPPALALRAKYTSADPEKKDKIDWKRINLRQQQYLQRDAVSDQYPLRPHRETRNINSDQYVLDKSKESKATRRFPYHHSRVRAEVFLK